MLHFGETACLPERREIQCGGIVSSCKFKRSMSSQFLLFCLDIFILVMLNSSSSSSGFCWLLQVEIKKEEGTLFHTPFFKSFTWNE
jgi:hypothetical protein